MRAIIQRVMKASVTVDDELVSSIGKGLCVLVGISRGDNIKDIEYIVRKILNTRLFEDDNDKRWAKNIVDKQYEVLCVSQFTLYHVLKGNKPDFHQAMGGDESKAFYEEFLKQIRSQYKPELIKDGAFGAYMQVNIQNDGPVTITLESPVQEMKKDPRQQKQKHKSQTVKENKPGDSKSCDGVKNTGTTSDCDINTPNVDSCHPHKSSDSQLESNLSNEVTNLKIDS